MLHSIHSAFIYHCFAAFETFHSILIQSSIDCSFWLQPERISKSLFLVIDAFAIGGKFNLWSAHRFNWYIFRFWAFRLEGKNRFWMNVFDGFNIKLFRDLYLEAEYFRTIVCASKHSALYVGASNYSPNFQWKWGKSFFLKVHWWWCSYDWCDCGMRLKISFQNSKLKTYNYNRNIQAIFKSYWESNTKNNNNFQN